MTDIAERMDNRISNKELERRWSAIRASMARRGIDVLLTQNNNDHMGGYVKYLTDLSAGNGYPLTVVFPRDDLMSLVRQGPFREGRDILEGDDPTVRGVKRVMTTPSYSSAMYTRTYDPELALTALKPYSKATIGLVGTYGASYALISEIKAALPQAVFVEASDLVDEIKVIKSDEEKDLIRRTAEIQDGAMLAAFAAIQPGMKDREVAAIAQKYCHERGSSSGIWPCASYRFGEPAHFGHWASGGRTIRDGDIFTILVESNGPGGFYTELGRTCVLGRAMQELVDELEFAKTARQFTLERLRPGNSCESIWREYNDFMRSNGRPEEARLYCHGQGYDLVERPLVRFDEPMPIKAGMNIVCHPTYMTKNVMSWICDNYLIEADGPGDRLHKIGEKIFERQ